MEFKSTDLENIMQLWEPVHVVNLDTRVLVGSVIRDVASPNLMYGFSNTNRDRLSELFEKAYADGCQHVGFIAPEFLYDTMYNTALDVAERAGGDWQVSPLEPEKYQDLIDKATLKLLLETAITEENEEIEAAVELMEKKFCDAIGLDTATIVALYGVDPIHFDEAAKIYNDILDNPPEDKPT